MQGTKVCVNWLSESQITHTFVTGTDLWKLVSFTMRNKHSVVSGVPEMASSDLHAMKPLYGSLIPSAQSSVSKLLTGCSGICIISRFSLADDMYLVKLH